MNSSWQLVHDHFLYQKRQQLLTTDDVFTRIIDKGIFFSKSPLRMKKVLIWWHFRSKHYDWVLRVREKKTENPSPRNYSILLKKPSTCWWDVKKRASNYICFQQLGLLNALFTSSMIWDFLATNPTYCKDSLVREIQVNYFSCFSQSLCRNWLCLFEAKVLLKYLYCPTCMMWS